MEPSLGHFTRSANKIRMEYQSLPVLQNQSVVAASEFGNSFFDQSGEFDYLHYDPKSTNIPLFGFENSFFDQRRESNNLQSNLSSTIIPSSGFESSFFDQSRKFYHLQSDLTSTNVPSTGLKNSYFDPSRDCNYFHSDLISTNIPSAQSKNFFFDQSREFNYLPSDLISTNISSSGFENHTFDQSREHNYLQSDMISTNVPLSSTLTHEDCEFSDVTLSFISQILMEEDMEDKTCMLQDSLLLQAAEQSFYEVLGEKYPPSSIRNQGLINENEWDPYNSLSVNHGNGLSSNGDISSIVSANPLLRNPSEFPSPSLQGNSITRSSYSSLNSVLGREEAPVDSPNIVPHVPDLNGESQSISQFRKGVEEASKFLPSGNDLFASLTKTLPQDSIVETDDGSSLGRSRGKKQLHREEGEVEEERSSKLASFYTEPTLRSPTLDIILLNHEGEGKVLMSARREALRNNNNTSLPPHPQSKASNSGRARGKKQNNKNEVVDLRILLVLCAQAIAADDYKSAHELLRQIRRHTSPFGDGNQRLANVFADGLEARLAGTGSQIYRGLVSKRTSAADMLKAYYLYLAACPFMKMSNYASNVTIRRSSENLMRVHVIDFGILYGLQWPTFIQKISMRTGGPPKLRITGIDFPQPGFRPAERVEETGRRLAAYAEGFNVPFEFNAIAKKWHTIQLEELKIDKDEFIVVTCFYRGKNLLDESVEVDSQKNTFLNLVKKINPDLFIHGIINAVFTAPFFITRFREALNHYSSLFDMLETIVPREEYERMVIEKEIFGREALNAIACEGCERVERAETYKQWQARTLRAGFVQQSFPLDIIQGMKKKVRDYYHKDFVVDEDSRWLLQGWKGRIIYALSCWKPA